MFLRVTCVDAKPEKRIMISAPMTWKKWVMAKLATLYVKWNVSLIVGKHTHGGNGL
jgi:hypothetical protein